MLFFVYNKESIIYVYLIVVHNKKKCCKNTVSQVFLKTILFFQSTAFIMATIFFNFGNTWQKLKFWGLFAQILL